VNAADRPSIRTLSARRAEVKAKIAENPSKSSLKVSASAVAHRVAYASVTPPLERAVADDAGIDPARDA
jgi:hypothetical protein